jgi:hypothetical protein
MLDLSRHDRALHALAFERRDEFREFSERKPMNPGTAGFDFGEGLFPDGSDDHIVTLRPGSVEHEQRKPAIPGNEAEFFCARTHRTPV